MFCRCSTIIKKGTNSSTLLVSKKQKMLSFYHFIWIRFTQHLFQPFEMFKKKCLRSRSVNLLKQSFSFIVLVHSLVCITFILSIMDYGKGPKILNTFEHTKCKYRITTSHHKQRIMTNSLAESR